MFPFLETVTSTVYRAKSLPDNPSSFKHHFLFLNPLPSKYKKSTPSHYYSWYRISRPLMGKGALLHLD